jgi:preprotein translocase subunit SecD
MKRPLVLVLLLVGSLGCSGTSSSPTLEFRLAEDEPAEGLTEVTLSWTNETFYVRDEVLLSEADVDSAFVTSRDDMPAVELLLTPAGAQKFHELTEQNVGKRCAMFLNGDLLSAPRIMSAIRGGRAILAGDLTEDEAIEAALGLNRR